MASIERPIHRRRFLHLLGGAVAAAGATRLWTHGARFLGVETAVAAAEGFFPLDEFAAAPILLQARSKGAGFAELYLEHRVVTRLSMSGGSIESVEQGIFEGAGVRAVDEDRTGYAYADSFDRQPLMLAARDAAAIASGAAKASATDRGWQALDPPSIVRFVRSFDNVMEDTRVAWLARADHEARAYDSAVQQVSIEYTDEMLRYVVANTDGQWVEDTLPLLYMRINVIAAKRGRRGTGLERVSRRLGAEQMDGDAAGLAGREAARMAVAMCRAAPAPAGEMPVVLAAGGGVLFHEAVGHGLEGDGVRKGTSFYAGRVGETVAAPLVSVHDSGALAELRGSYNVDDEGAVPQDNLLIEKGVLRGFLNDRITAQALNAPRTGNGRRQSYRYPPLVRMSNTYLAPGTDDASEIIRQTRSGLFARTLGGGEVDTTTGNFTFGVLEGYRIENGKVTTPVIGANLVGSGPEIMKRIDRVGPDQKFWAGTCGKGQWVPVSSGAPTLRISSMTVGGTA